MLNEPPCVYLCAAVQDRPFVESLYRRLRPRGLAMHDGGELAGLASSDGERQHVMDTCKLILVVISRASAPSAAVMADYRYAIARGFQTIPLIVSSVKDLPADLSHVQAINFATDDQEGWAALLIALDTAGIARFPVLSPPNLDVEVVVARARSGLTPPAWYIHRNPVPGPRQLSSWTIYGATVTILLTILAFFALGRNPLIALPAIYVVYQLYIKFSPVSQRIQKNSATVILTPDGFVVVTTTGSAVSAAYRDATTSVPIERAQTGDVHLQVNPGSGRPPVDMTLSKFPGEGMLGQQALAYYQAYVARYITGNLTPTRPIAPAPLLFISYSRKDAAFIDRLELSLQSVGFNVWVDRSNLLGGQSWSAEVQQAIEQCAVLVVAVSPDALRSAAVRREYEYALQCGKPVFGALVRSARRIPPELRQHMVSDHRQNLLLGVLELALTLDRAGIHPLAAFASLPGGRVSQSSAVLVAETLHGRTSPNSVVYRASLPARFALSMILLLLIAAVGCWLFLQSGDLYPLFIASVVLFGLGVPNLLFLRRRLRYPDIIITLSEGYITFFNSARLLEYPYDSMSALTLAPPSLFSGTTLVNTGIGSNSPLTVRIRPGFHQSRKIAQRIIADFNRYKRQAGGG